MIQLKKKKKMKISLYVPLITFSIIEEKSLFLLLSCEKMMCTFISITKCIAYCIHLV